MSVAISPRHVRLRLASNYDGPYGPRGDFSGTRSPWIVATETSDRAGLPISTNRIAA